MSKNRLLQRSNVHVHFKNADMDFIFQWVLGNGKLGGLDIGEAFHVASRIKDGDPSSWIREFRDYGDRFVERARQLEQANRQASAAETWMKAFNCYRAAAQFGSPKQAEFKELIEAFKGQFQRAAALLDLPLEAVRIPYEDKHLPGYFLRASNTDSRATTLIVIGGGDTYCEDLYTFAGLAGHRRGYHTLMVDLPGQGDTPFHGLHLISDYERPVRHIVDFLLERPEVDPERVAIIGFSGGGYMVTRAVSKERRIKACIANTPLFDTGQLLEAEIPRALAEAPGLVMMLLMRITNAVNKAGAANLEKILWQAGVETLDEFFDVARGGHVDLSQIQCAFYSMVGEGDPVEAQRQAQIAHETIPSPQKAYRVFTMEEGAEAHCQVANLTLLHQEVYDWLDSVFPKGAGAPASVFVAAGETRVHG